jgi:hypothetical protein
VPTFFLDNPLGLVSAIAIPILVALYFWQRKATSKIVPAIFLWPAENRSSNAGAKWRITRLPLDFYQFLLAIILLILAAAVPYVVTNQKFPPLNIILDDSMSTQAGKTKEKAIDHIESVARKFPQRRFLVYLAGHKPTLIHDDSKLPNLAQIWLPGKSNADLKAALAFAKNNCPSAEYIIVTDHIPTFEIPEDTAYVAFGKSFNNLAIVNAKRNDDKIMLELANAGDKQANATLIVNKAQQQLDFKPDERKSLVVKCDETIAEIHLKAQDDQLEADNYAMLVNDYKPPVNVKIHDAIPEKLKNAIRRTIQTNINLAEKADAQPELIIEPASEDTPHSASRILWYLPADENAAISDAPIVPVTAHPILDGVPLGNLIWPANHNQQIPGTTLLAQASTTLLAIQNKQNNAFDLMINLHQSLGNVHRNPAWPTLFENIAQYIKANRPGPTQANYTDNESIQLNLHSIDATKITHATQDSKTTINTDNSKKIVLEATNGLHQFTTESHTWNVAVNTLDPEESDLTNAASFKKDIATQIKFRQATKSNIAWLLALLAILVLIPRFNYP